MWYGLALMRKRRTTASPRSSQLGEPTRRINITMLESQHDELVRRGVSVSGVIRELVAQYLSGTAITVHVDPATRQLYDTVISQAGATDEDVAAQLKVVLQGLLDQRVAELEQLRRQLNR